MQALMLFADKDNWPPLPSVDIWFFVICALIVVAIIAIYYLIPVFNKKKYQEQRDNLAKREAAFKANHPESQQAEEKSVVAEVAVEENAVEEKPAAKKPRAKKSSAKVEKSNTESNEHAEG